MTTSEIVIPSALTEKVKLSLERIKAFDPSVNGNPYYLAFSGGKDSLAVKTLMDMAGVKYRAVYRHTSVDPPELVQFIRSFSDVETDYPRYRNGQHITMWNLIPKEKMLPTRIMRFCCKRFKETGGTGNVVVTGVRWAESPNRRKNAGSLLIKNKGRKDTKFDENFEGQDVFQKTSKGGWITNSDDDEARRMLEMCYRTHKTTMNPIVDWETDEVWNFLKSEGVQYCSLYDEGFDRIGCIGCPMASPSMRARQFERWPTYRAAYINAIRKMLEVRAESGKPWENGETPEEVFEWWVESDKLKAKEGG